MCARELWGIAFAKITGPPSNPSTLFWHDVAGQFFLPSAGHSAGDWKHGKPQSAGIVENAHDFLKTRPFLLPSSLKKCKRNPVTDLFANGGRCSHKLEQQGVTKWMRTINKDGFSGPLRTYQCFLCRILSRVERRIMVYQPLALRSVLDC